MEQYSNYVVIALVLALIVRRWLKIQSVRKKLPELLKSGAVVVDVRSPSEFASGHYEGSINIPLSDLASSAKTLDPTKPVLLCCASGSRSGAAVGILKAKGFKEVYNGGPWMGLTSK